MALKCVTIYCTFYVDLKMITWHVLILRHNPMSFISFLLSLGSMSHVNFRKWSRRHVEFRVQEPLGCVRSTV